MNANVMHYIARTTKLLPSLCVYKIIVHHGCPMHCNYRWKRGRVRDGAYILNFVVAKQI